MKKHINMQIIFVPIIILAFWQYVEGNISSKECYDPTEDNGELMLKMLFTKLNTILEQNVKINQNFIELNKRQDQLDTNIQQIMKHLNSSQYVLNDTNTNLESCKAKTDWTVIQRRQDGSVDFFRNWTDYKQGFGNESGEFFIGLERLHHMTHYVTPHELLIVLTDFNNQTRRAKYDKFVIGSEFEKYSLKELGNYSGDAGDSLSSLKGKQFSTKDQQNDEFILNCAEFYMGGWWFGDCAVVACNLNGPYRKKFYLINKGIIWATWHGYYYPLKSVEMMIRPITNSN